MSAYNPYPGEEPRGMKRPLVASVLLHLGVLAILLVGIPQFSRDRQMSMSVPVEMLTEDDLLDDALTQTPIEPADEAEVEAASESDSPEATAESEAESIETQQSETAAPSEAPAPTQEAPAETAATAQPTPPTPSRAPEVDTAANIEAAPEIAATAELAEAPPAEASPQPPSQSTAAPEQSAALVPDAPETPTAELAAPSEEAQTSEEPALTASEPESTEAQETETAESAPAETTEMAEAVDAPPVPRPRPAEVPSSLQQAEAPDEETPEETSQEESTPVEPPVTEAESESEADPLASILRNVEDLEPQREQQASAPTPSQESAAPRNSAAVQRRAAELGNMIRDQVASCWRIDGGRQEARGLLVPIRVRLASDGSVIGSPRVQEPGRYASDGYYRSAADAAVRAVLACSPFDLPPQDYDLWRDLVLNFDPREMFGG